VLTQSLVGRIINRIGGRLRREVGI
jgi:hypothetical protein